MPRISVKNLSVVYYKNKKIVENAINDLTCSFNSGEITAVIGPSGSGKTTLLKSILGLINYKGEIYFDDIDVNSISLKEKNIAYISQDVVLYPHYTVFQNIAFPLLNSGATVEEARKRTYEVSKKLNIETILSRKPKQISLGQAQRVCLAKAIVKRAYLYLFDEPFSNLDEKMRFSLRHDLKQTLKEISATAIFVTHSIEEAFMMADKILVMDKGEIIEYKTPLELQSSENELVRELLKDGQH